MKYKILRLKVKLKQRYELREKNRIFKGEPREHLDLVQQVLNTAKSHNNCIFFDPSSNETLIIFADAIYTVSAQTISIDNHSNFIQMKVAVNIYEWLLEELKREAHRYRRKLKYTARQNKLIMLKLMSHDKEDTNAQPVLTNDVWIAGADINSQRNDILAKYKAV